MKTTVIKDEYELIKAYSHGIELLKTARRYLNLSILIYVLAGILLWTNGIGFFIVTFCVGCASYLYALVHLIKAKWLLKKIGRE